MKETRVESNEVVLAPLSSLYKQEMWLGEWNLVENSRVLGANEVIVKIRYRKQANRCRVTLTVEGLLRVRLMSRWNPLHPGRQRLSMIRTDTCWAVELFFEPYIRFIASRTKDSKCC